MSNFVIKHIDGTETDLISNTEARAIKSAVQNAELMGGDIVTIVVLSANLFGVNIGDRMQFFGRTYQINTLPTIKKTGAEKYEYTLIFEGPQYQLINAAFLLPEETALDSYTGTVADFMRILSDNIARLYPDEWNAPEIDIENADETKTLSYNDQNCLQVLQNLCGEFKVEFRIRHDNNGKNTIVIKSKVGEIFAQPFKFGAGGGVYELTRDKQTETDLITRLYVYGDSKNLPAGYGYDRLCLPYVGTGNKKNASFVEDEEAAEIYGIHEGVKEFGDIFPEYEGTVSEKADELTFTDVNFPFDLGEKDEKGNTKYLIKGKNAKITFQTGNLAGYQFEIDRNKYEYKAGEGLKVVLIRYTDNVGQTLPMPEGEAGAAAYQFKNGDKYIISEIYLPDAFVKDAEQRLKEKALATLAETKRPAVTYSLNIDQQWLEKLAGTSVEVRTLFDVGDTLTIDDNTTGATGLRITAFERDILKPYKYTFTLGEKVSASAIQRIVNNITGTQTVIKNNKLDDPGRFARNWQTTQDILNAIFDTEGNYYTERIKPLSIETTMLAVGARSQQFILSGVSMMPNYGGDVNTLFVTNGTLVHYTINGDDTPRTWYLSNLNVSGLLNKQYFIYARCERDGQNGFIELSSDAKTVESDPANYYFLIGTISAPIVAAGGSARQIVQSYGLTRINGRFLNTGRIQSADGTCYFDLDRNEIFGNIKFLGANGETTAAEVESKTAAVNSLVNTTIVPTLESMQNQIDGKIDQWFYNYNPTLTNEPANAWTTETERIKHSGDLFYNIDSGKVWRFVKEGDEYKWVILEDNEAAAALAIANDALMAAQGARQIFTEEPEPPYKVNDLYIKPSGEILQCKKSRETGIFYLSDWEEFADFGNKEVLNEYIKTTNATIKDMQASLDGKIETWYQGNDPSVNWIDYLTCESHIGDLWIKGTGSAKMIYRYMKNPAGGYKWELISDGVLIEDAADEAAEALDKVESKCTTFVIEPYPPYNIGDLWLTGGAEDGELLRCIYPRDENEEYDRNDWAEAVYYDNTEVTIENGLITAGSLQIVGTNTQSVVAGITGADSGDNNTAADDIRIWAGTEKAARDKAPFRVRQDGKLYATDAEIEGNIKANSGQIAGFEIANDHIGKERKPDTKTEYDADGLSIYANFIKFTNYTNRRCAIIGTTIKTDDETDGPVAGYFEATGLPTQTETKNIAGYFKAAGNRQNIAIQAVGDVVIDGNLFASKMAVIDLSAAISKAKALNHISIYQTNVLKTTFVSPSAYSYLGLPTLDELRTALNITDNNKVFAVQLTYIARQYSPTNIVSAGAKIIRYGAYAAKQPVIYPGNKTEIDIAIGEAAVLQYVYDGESFYVIKM